MPNKKRPSALYQRGDYRLEWDRRTDGTLRTPFLSVFWYDPERGRGRSVSTGTADLDGARTWLDAFYLGRSTGAAVCPTCGRVRDDAAGHLVTDAISTYLTLHGDDRSSSGAISARLAHVVAYIGSLPSQAVACEEVDTKWIERFRSWAEKQPIVSPSGVARVRSLSTIEGSVAQLSAAINHAYARGDTTGPARFKAIPIRQLNRTPEHRSSITEIAAMFRYCVQPDVSEHVGTSWGHRAAPLTADELIVIRRRERASLHRFLIMSVASLGRPDAVHDVSLDPKRRQWNSNARILGLNPKGRRQTKKYRAVVPIAWQVAPLLDAAPRSFFVGVASVRRAWDAMAAAIGLPTEGEAGLKLIRRSMADLLRSRLPEEAWGEISMMMGHSRFDVVTDLYAPFKPTYLRRVLSEIEAIIGDIEKAIPGAFRRSNTGDGAEIIPLGVSK